jgi:hypothetical protein
MTAIRSFSGYAFWVFLCAALAAAVPGASGATPPQPTAGAAARTAGPATPEDAVAGLEAAHKAGAVTERAAELFTGPEAALQQSVYAAFIKLSKLPEPKLREAVDLYERAVRTYRRLWDLEAAKRQK